MGPSVNRFARIGKVRGQPIAVGGRQVVPVAWTISLGFAADKGGAGFAWTRPVAVEVLDARGTIGLRVPDATLRAVLAIVAAGLLPPLILFVCMKSARRLAGLRGREAR